MDKEAQGNAENIIREAGNELLRAWGILAEAGIDVSGGYRSESTVTIPIDDDTMARIDFSVTLTINDMTFLNEGNADD